MDTGKNFKPTATSKLAKRFGASTKNVQGLKERGYCKNNFFKSCMS